MAQKTVIKLNNIPHGFHEKQMKDYFTQFGPVKNVILIRSKKTHNSRGFGFVEFTLPQIARAAAEAMHNYMIFKHVLKCRVMNKNDLPKNLFKIKYTKQVKKPFDLSAKKLRHHYKAILEAQDKLKKSGINLKCHIINVPASK